MSRARLNAILDELPHLETGEHDELVARILATADHTAMERAIAAWWSRLGVLARLDRSAAHRLRHASRQAAHAVMRRLRTADAALDANRERQYRDVVDELEGAPK